jgi:hypothetical protein
MGKREDEQRVPWRRRERGPVDFRRYPSPIIFYVVADSALLYGGFSVLTGLDQNGNPLVGALALLGGLALLTPAVLYLRRPVRPSPDQSRGRKL